MQIAVHHTFHDGHWHRAYTPEAAARALARRIRVASAFYGGVGLATGLVMFAMQDARFAWALLVGEVGILAAAVWPRPAPAFTLERAIAYLAARRARYAAMLVAPILAGIAGLGLDFAARTGSGGLGAISACLLAGAAALAAMAVHRARRSMAVAQAIVRRPIAWACAHRTNAVVSLKLRFADGTAFAHELPEAAVAGALLELERREPAAVIGFRADEYRRFLQTQRRLSVHRVALVALVALVACGTPREAAPDRGHYARMVAAWTAGLASLPADASTLPRCDPGMRDVLELDVGDAGPALAHARSFDYVSWAGRKLDQVTEKQPDAKRWFDQYEHAAFVRFTRWQVPVMHGCAPSATKGVTTCDLELGHAAGDVIVVDDAGKPTCARHVEVAGPTSGDQHVVEMFGIAVREVVSATFSDGYLARKDILALNGEWQVDLDGARVADMRR